ncbi:UDP-N-acetylmuramoyl-L-alanine--D-glutamate ligase [Candidatus Villigracilis affinis]|uniref:UDP-N-acetylmuramoyl-L-alanine--D-glutamate ligase n=1 Tax=Candidatus Villigracilis affinis TaxID=3140682 RepID=UPI001E199887|nr:UDP-N-acetylmuramoyl-L-alanine--D-glutamate ligase [Anaerolineales bacterium]
MMTNWNGTRTLILGAARQGIALARWLSRHGSNVTLSDSRSLEQLASARESLADTNVTWAAGGHPLELLDTTDVLCLSGGVPLTLPIVQEAVKRGIPLSNDTQIFMEVVPCKTIGITGSAGKTTTTTLVGKMAQRTKDEGGRMKDEESKNSSAVQSIHPSVFVGGNIGDPLINYVDDMTADDLAILEISSFQLEQMTISPNIAAILNITPNHLDRHGTMEAYTNAKARILEFQTEKDTAILSHDDKGAWNLRNKVNGKLLTFSLYDLAEGLNGAYMHEDGLLSLRDGYAYLPLMLREKIKLPGLHNVANVLAAFTIGHAAGFKLDAMLEAVEEFRGVAHRLEFVRELRGVRWYNGSIATAPERSMADIHAFDEPIVLMLGGRDKDLPWDEIAKLIHKRVDHVVLFGEAAELIQKAISAVGGERSVDLRRAEHLKEAVALAAEVASAGDIVLFSPGGTSYDEFKDFAERGENFRKWVQELS